MPHEVKLILGSSCKNGPPIFTLRCRYWRAIHAEVNTHRGLNKNAGSSRAVPVAKMLDMVRNDTAGPTHWGKNQKGMQAEVENNEPLLIPGPLREAFETFVRKEKPEGGQFGNMFMSREVGWRFSAWLAAEMSEAFSDAGYHKQVANRITEPYQWINVVLTGTLDMWEHFWRLRDHKDAMPEFQAVAHDTKLLIQGCKPQELRLGQWHVPFIRPNEDLLPLEVKLKLSAARCAHTSFETVDGFDMTLDKAEEIFGKLMGGDPQHASPTEHQAVVGGLSKQVKAYRSPLSEPWIQYRKLIENGCEV
jgi:hypothetical protein